MDKYATRKAVLSKLAIETRRNNMNGVNENKGNLRGLLHRKITTVISFINSDYGKKELTIDNFSNAIAGQGQQRKSEKIAR